MHGRGAPGELGCLGAAGEELQITLGGEANSAMHLMRIDEDAPQRFVAVRLGCAHLEVGLALGCECPSSLVDQVAECVQVTAHVDATVRDRLETADRPPELLS